MKTFFQKIWPVGVIFFVWLLFAYPSWGKGLVPFPSTYLVTFFSPWSSLYGMPVKNNAMPDVITQIYPWKHMTVETWKRKEVPLWNPYSFSGTSHIGTYQTAIFSPINALFLFLPEIDAWSIMILLQPVFAGFFMLIFLRSLRVSAASSVVGSLAYMFCGFIVVWMAYGTLGYAVAYLPLILYGIQAKKYVVISIGMALSFLSGHFQMSLYVLLFAAAFSVSIRQWKPFVYLLLGVALAAPQLLPAYDAYRQAVRSSLFQKGEVIPWQYIVTMVAPDFYGNPVTRNDWFGHYAEWAGFIGVAPLMLALFRPTGFFAVAALVSLLFAYQTPLVDLLYAAKIPVLSTSSASRIILLASFSLAVLSAFGLDRLIEVWKKRNRKKSLIWFGSMAAGVALLWATLLFVKPLPADKLIIAVRNTYLPTAFALGVIIIAAAGCIVPKKYAGILPYLFIVITAVDVYRFATKWMPFDSKEYVYPALPVISKLNELTKEDHSRVFGNIGNEVGSRFGLPLIDGYDALYQHRYGTFISSVSTGIPHPLERSVVTFDKHGKYSEDVLELLGVRYYLHKKSDGRFVWAYPFWEYPQYRLVWEDNNFQILENTQSFPRAFLASSYKVETKDQNILNALYSVNRRDTVILEKEPAIAPKSGAGEAVITSYRPTEVVIHTTAEMPKLLFVSDVYDAGWRATVDGKPVELYRANFAFRAVSVPSGSHTIRMWYMPQRVVMGFWIAGFATLGLFGMKIVNKARKKEADMRTIRSKVHD